MTPFQVARRRWVRPLSLLGCVLALVSIIWPGAAAPLPSASPHGRSAADQRIDPPAVGYATTTDRTLIRWIWNRPSAPTFRVYRRQGDGTETLLGRVAPITDQQAAVTTLTTTDSRWPDLYNDILRDFRSEHVTDFRSFQSYMQTNRLAGQKLAAERYPVALVLGWGYLDLSLIHI